MFGEFPFIPAQASNPVAGFYRFDFGLHSRNNFFDRGRIRELDAVKLVDSTLGNMRMRVDQARRDGVALKVNDAQGASLALELKDFGIGSNFDDHATADCESLHYGIFRIDGENV